MGEFYDVLNLLSPNNTMWNADSGGAPISDTRDVLLTTVDLQLNPSLATNNYTDVWMSSSGLPSGDFDNTNFSNSESVDLKPNTEGFVVPGDVATTSSYIAIQNVISSSVQIPSSLPPNQTWVGEYGFDLNFGPQQKTTKGATWTYSEINDKLYVMKDAPCPVNISVNRLLVDDDFKIRGQVMFTSPEYATEFVTRCMSHYHEDTQKGISYPEHLMRCESSMASYETDSSTNQYSVTVPFENPAAGETFSTYIFKFTCFGSCNGGPGRRPLILVLTLEKGGIVVGRRSIDIKICACPSRDKKSDERWKNTDQPKRKQTNLFSEISESVDLVNTMFPSKKRKTSSNPNGPHSINAKDKDECDYLHQMRKLYRIHTAIKNLPSDKQSIKSMLNDDDGE